MELRKRDDFLFFCVLCNLYLATRIPPTPKKNRAANRLPDSFNITFITYPEYARCGFHLHSVKIVLLFLLKASILTLRNTIIESVISMNGVKDIRERLLRLDEDAALMFDDDGRFICILVGGSALILLGYISRVTHDIDMLVTPPELLKLLEKYDMNINVSAYMDNFPDDYAQRICKLDLPTEKIDFYTLSLEDLVISKLAAARDKDLFDITSEEILKALDWAQLAELAVTVQDGMLNDRVRAEFRFAYDAYVKRYHP